MRRLPVWFFLSLVVAIALPLGVAAADTGISFGLHIGDRYRGPSLGFYDQPNVVAVPGRVGVYYVQGSDQDLYRYNNTWYMNYNGDWYRADSYNGPFTFVGYRSVPSAHATRFWRNYPAIPRWAISRPLVDIRFRVRRALPCWRLSSGSDCGNGLPI